MTPLDSKFEAQGSHDPKLLGIKKRVLLARVDRLTEFRISQFELAPIDLNPEDGVKFCANLDKNTDKPPSKRT